MISADIIVSITADVHIEMTITLDLLVGFGHMRGLFGVVFHAQSNGEVTVQIS